ncbi:MAG: hypothetical protein ACRD8U_24995, partial [Pyrinomonadaceae bacterium]
MKRHSALMVSLAVVLFANCSSNNDNAHTTAETRINPPPTQNLQIVPRPQAIVDEMRARGEQDEAKPILRILSPAEGAVITGSIVVVRIALDGDLKGYQPHQDSVTGQGNHIHIILDNEPYEAYYELDQPFELRNVVAGKHTLRVFPSRPWHESHKNEGAFQMVTFTVRGGGNASQEARAGNDVQAST